MTPELLFYAGGFLCAAALLCAIAAAVILRVSRSRLDRKLDSEYGKRRH